jgi:hypothetical protein
MLAFQPFLVLSEYTEDDPTKAMTEYIARM